jgi:hypothetical protein
VRETVDVIIRTAGKRRASLERAINSILDQQHVAARPVIVANGAPLPYAMPAPVKLHQVPHKITPGAALHAGRRLVTAPLFAFLDDDDELLPDALSVGVATMRSDPTVDLVVTPGFWITNNKRIADIPDIAREQNDPLGGILERCWLNPGGGLFRTSSLPHTYFHDLPPLCEWTFLAFRLALDGRNIRFLEHPTYLAHDTLGSLSKSASYVEATVEVLSRMRRHRIPATVQARLEKKYRAALHEAAERSLNEGQHVKAWRFHLRSLISSQALSYFPYTRKLLCGA